MHIVCFRKNRPTKIAKTTILGVGRLLPKDPTAEDSPDIEWAGRNVIGVGRRLTLNDLRASDRACSLIGQEHQHDASIIASDVEKENEVERRPLAYMQPAAFSNDQVCQPNSGRWL
jgi:hypothetical protein